MLYSDYKFSEDFLNTSTYDVVEILAAEAERTGFLVFTYRPSLKPNFKFPEFYRRGALTAFADYLSFLPNENEHTEASKYLDTLPET